MEQEFLRALQSFYYDQKAIMSNEEFDNLKEELMWEGSSVVMLSADEQRLLEASMAYIAGNPIMSDAEFDELKLRLKQDGSDIVTEGPRCSLRSRKCYLFTLIQIQVYSDLTVDYLKMFLLNVPATIVALGLFFFIDELTGFEVNVFQFPEPFGFIFTYFAALPLILVTAQVVTKAIINDVLILKLQNSDGIRLKNSADHTSRFMKRIIIDIYLQLYQIGTNEAAQCIEDQDGCFETIYELRLQFETKELIKGERLPIESYNVKDLYAVRKAYILKGACRPYAHELRLEYQGRGCLLLCMLPIQRKQSRGKGTGVFLDGSWKNWNRANDALQKHVGDITTVYNKAMEIYNLFFNPKATVDDLIVKDWHSAGMMKWSILTIKGNPTTGSYKAQPNPHGKLPEPSELCIPI
ncbi:hypothetical protein TRIUR3_31517 [Triticum urartu]|uniref:PGR5-like protein 1B, chloroplastic n=1 Tax=Triticum urartu TaxID=4572 RepID=M7YHC6_TRIUA|nr:hypothetical protein TRIUR3_31517 [Triticum urartu]